MPEDCPTARSRHCFWPTRRPELVRALVLAEPPAISLHAHVHGGKAARGKAMFYDIQQRMVLPMQQAFHVGDRELFYRLRLR